jgi:hypothetical protein
VACVERDLEEPAQLLLRSQISLEEGAYHQRDRTTPHTAYVQLHQSARRDRIVFGVISPLTKPLLGEKTPQGIYTKCLTLAAEAS